MTPSQKRGVQLFLKSLNKVVLGCIEMSHASFFSDEKFHNIAAVQVGRGKQPNGEDYGRRGVTQKDDDRYKFRTPSLLNVAATAPYTNFESVYKLSRLLSTNLISPSRCRTLITALLTTHN